MVLCIIAAKRKRLSKDDFKGRQSEAWLIRPSVSLYSRYLPSIRDLKEILRDSSFDVDHNSIGRSILARIPVIEKRIRRFWEPLCGAIRVDETYVKIRRRWRYLYRAFNKHSNKR